MEKTTQELIGVGVGVLILLIIIYVVYYYYYMHPKCTTASTDCKNTKYPLCGVASTANPPVFTAPGRCLAGATAAAAATATTPAITVGGCPSGYGCSSS